MAGSSRALVATLHPQSFIAIFVLSLILAALEVLYGQHPPVPGPPLTLSLSLSLSADPLVLHTNHLAIHSCCTRTTLPSTRVAHEPPCHLRTNLCLI